MGEKSGSWYGDRWYFGLHYDLHANKKDTELGTHCSPEELCPMLKKVGADFVQTDCKGHPGMTSWFTQVKDGTVSPGVVKDALAQWREATKRLGLPLHCHYSGIWDMAAARKHPEWAVVKAPGADKPSEKMCPRGPYLKKLLIPQLFEAIDRYGVDAIMIGRAAVGCPWIFKTTKEYLATGVLPPEPDVHERVRLAKLQLSKSMEWKGDKRGILEMRRHYSQYFKALPDFKNYRMKLVTSMDVEEIMGLLDEVEATYGGGVS